MSNVVIGILGNRLDHRGLGKRRWACWRPSISLLKQTQFVVNVFFLIYHKKDKELADLTVSDMYEISPNIQVIPYEITVKDAWNFEQVYSALHHFSKKHQFDPETNQYYIHITTGTHVAQICLYLLTEANYLPGKLIQSMPSRDNPSVGSYQIIDLDLSCYDQIASRFEQEARSAICYLKDGIDTKNKAFNRLIAQLEKVSIRSKEPILITGPTGVGKSRLARRIYELKKKRCQLQGSLVEVNCATLRGDNAMSALFGHVKGAFTGAIKERIGLLKEANNGLLFLDEIGELGLDEQAMLLRAIEDKHFMPLGSDKETQSNFQLIAGSNKQLFKQVDKGKFREDLLARINLWSYELPSLKDRIEDLLPNIQHELDAYTQKMGYKIDFNKDAKDKYVAFCCSKEALWKANFRDLNSSIIRMATLSHGGRINEQRVAEEIKRLRSDWHGRKNKPNNEGMLLLNQLLGSDALLIMDYFDQLQLAQVLQVCRYSNSMADAGRKLFNVSREAKTNHNDSHRLRQYLKKFGIKFKAIRSV